jgi:hypothetical protein
VSGVYDVSLVKLRGDMRCTGKHCRVLLEPYTALGARHGFTRYRPANGRNHTRICETRLWGQAVALGAPFATCEHTDDTHHAPLGGVA